MILRKFSVERRSQFRSIQKELYQHVNVLSNEIGSRNSFQYSALAQAAYYIKKQMSQYDSNLLLQEYQIENQKFYNLVLEKPGEIVPDEIIVIGAHYDTVLNSPGADDNASGIACLLELIRLLQNYSNRRTIRFVAFTLEEPPFFASEQMGSQVYARSCRAKNENIIGMIALEMLGYYTVKKNSQKAPFKDLKGKYSDKGDFIAVVGNESSRPLTEKFTASLKHTSLIKTELFIPFSYLPEIELSDHSSFWKQNYSAIMITDTAFYRNPNYHEAGDTIDTLNFRYFAKLVFSLVSALQLFDQHDII